MGSLLYASAKSSTVLTRKPEPDESLDVDFKNLTVTFWEDDKGKPLLFHLRNGKYDLDNVPNHLGHTSVELAGIHYLDSADNGREFALALYEEDDVGGGSNQEGVAQVFELANNRLRVAQELEWDLHHGGQFGPLDTFDDRTNSLEIHSSHYQRATPTAVCLRRCGHLPLGREALGPDLPADRAY